MSQRLASQSFPWYTLPHTKHLKLRQDEIECRGPNLAARVSQILAINMIELHRLHMLEGRRGCEVVSYWTWIGSHHLPGIVWRWNSDHLHIGQTCVRMLLERMWVSYYDDFPIFSVGVRFQFPNSIGCSPNSDKRRRTFLVSCITSFPSSCRQIGEWYV